MPDVCLRVFTVTVFTVQWAHSARQASKVLYGFMRFAGVPLLSATSCNGVTHWCRSTGSRFQTMCRYDYLPARAVCRNSKGACDVEEVCTGYLPDCPSDRWAKNGQVCSSSMWHAYPYKDSSKLSWDHISTSSNALSSKGRYQLVSASDLADEGLHVQPSSVGVASMKKRTYYCKKKQEVWRLRRVCRGGMCVWAWCR
jgi:hypothetical protein